LKKFCSCETYYDIRSINLKNTAMKKQEMINTIIQSEKLLWENLQECIDRLGMNDPITDAAVARWAVVHNLVQKLGLK
jgi:hypothetical protein